jgi:hypothetical protein
MYRRNPNRFSRAPASQSLRHNSFFSILLMLAVAANPSPHQALRLVPTNPPLPVVDVLVPQIALVPP